MQRDEVGVLEQSVEVGHVAGDAGGVTSVVHDAHAKSDGPSRDRAPDTAEADDAERRVVDVLAEILRHRPLRPTPGAEVALGFRGETGRREDEHEGEVGGGLAEDARRVAHEHAVRGRRRDIDVVVAHGHGGDDPQPARAGREHGVVDPVGEDADDRVDVGRRGLQFGGRVRRVVGLGADDLVPCERVEPTLGELPGDEDPGHSAAYVALAGAAPQGAMTTRRVLDL